MPYQLSVKLPPNCDVTFYTSASGAVPPCPTDSSHYQLSHCVRTKDNGKAPDVCPHLTTLSKDEFEARGVRPSTDDSTDRNYFYVGLVRKLGNPSEGTSDTYYVTDTIRRLQMCAAGDRDRGRFIYRNSSRYIDKVWPLITTVLLDISLPHDPSSDATCRVNTTCQTRFATLQDLAEWAQCA